MDHPDFDERTIQLPPLSSKDFKLSDSQEQYWRIKKNYGDTILFFKARVEGSATVKPPSLCVWFAPTHLSTQHPVHPVSSTLPPHLPTPFFPLISSFESDCRIFTVSSPYLSRICRILPHRSAPSTSCTRRTRTWAPKSSGGSSPSAAWGAGAPGSCGGGTFPEDPPRGLN